MRFLIVGLCVFATACSGTASTSPTAPTAALSQGGGGVLVTAATNALDLPFNGDLHGTESNDTPHHLVATGNGGHLGRFTYTADITVDDTTGHGAGPLVWVAANGDQIFANALGSIAGASASSITIAETQTITGGTGRFAGASGSIMLSYSIEFATGSVKGSYTGTIDLGH